MANRGAQVGCQVAFSLIGKWKANEEGVGLHPPWQRQGQARHPTALEVAIRISIWLRKMVRMAIDISQMV